MSLIKTYPFQEESIDKIEDFDGRVLLALEMGLGKTLTSLMALKRNPDWLPALVVCPASVKYTWEHEALSKLQMQSSICEGMKPPRFNGRDFRTATPLTIINYDILNAWKEYLKKLKFKTLILDESHNIANQKAKRTKAVKDISRRIPRTFALSGTPLTNRPAELWSTLNILWPDRYKSFWDFANSYCNSRWTPWGWRHDGAQNLDKLHQELISQGMIRRRKADVLQELPDKVRRVIPCELRRPEEYELARTDFIAWLRQNQGHKVRRAAKAQALIKIGYLLRIAARLKMKSVVDWANQFLEETDEKLILFAVHRKAIDVLQRRIKAHSVVVDGSVTGRKRKIAVDQFQNNRNTRVFIGNIKAAGVGITLTAASEVGFAEMYWRPGDHIQAEDRPHRIGQKNTVFINYFVARNTIEEDLCQILEKKQRIISSVLDGKQNPEDLNIYEDLLKIIEQRFA